MSNLSRFQPDPSSARHGFGAFDARPALRTDRRRPLSVASRVAPYRLLVEGGVDVFSRHDRAGRFLDCSPAAADVLGRSPRELLGRYWHDLVHRDDRLRFEGWWHNLHGGAAMIITFRVNRPDGSVVRVETAACAGVLLEDQVFEVQALTREAASAEPADDPAASRHGRELETRAAQLDRANRDLARFAGDVAHDLRGPLQVISGFAQLIARVGGNRLEEASQQALAYILAAAGDMGEMIDAALDHANPAVGQARPGMVDSTEIALRTVQRLRVEIDAAGASVEIREMPDVFGNAPQIGRVFQNLIANALKAARPGHALQVVVSGRPVRGGWELCVADDGIGIPHRDRDRIFRMLERCWPVAGTEGTGRGLAICKSIVERHGGRIWVGHEPGGGSCFTFYLPEPRPSGLGSSGNDTGGAFDGRLE